MIISPEDISPGMVLTDIYNDKLLFVISVLLSPGRRKVNMLMFSSTNIGKVVISIDSLNRHYYTIVGDT
jgi:hypothetical protein